MNTDLRTWIETIKQFHLPAKDSVGYLLLGAAISIFVQKAGARLLGWTIVPFQFIGKRLFEHLIPKGDRALFMRRYRRHILTSDMSRIDTIVGPDIHVPLEFAFAPLQLISGDKYQKVNVHDYAERHNEFIVLGAPGTGKTTLMKALVASIASKRSNYRLNQLIPIIVTVRALAKHEGDIRLAAAAELKRLEIGRIDFLDRAFRSGEVLVILDGLDEVGNARTRVIEGIKTFQTANTNTKNVLIITCREAGFDPEDFRGVIGDILRVETFTDYHIRTFLTGWPAYNGRYPATLLPLLDNQSQLKDVCRNPLMLTILAGLYLSAGENFELPSSRNDFYRLAVKELLLNRPRRRDVPLHFSFESKLRLLEELAYVTIVANETDSEELGTGEIEKAAARILSEEMGLPELLQELNVAAGILKPTGDDTFTFAHRTFQEFFAASYAFRNLDGPEALGPFFGRADLFESLTFYCGMVSNRLSIEQILNILIGKQRWLLAGRCVLAMQMVHPLKAIAVTANALAHMVEDPVQAVPSLEILLSLAQRSGDPFDPARNAYDDLVNRLVASTHKSVSDALFVALRNSPETAIRFARVLSIHPDKRLRISTYRLLAETGTKQGLEMLFASMLTREEDRSSIACVVASCLPARHEEILESSGVLPYVNSHPLWPFDRYLSTRTAIYLAEAIAAGRVASGNGALDHAAWAVKISAKRPLGPLERLQLYQWRTAGADLRIRAFRRAVRLVPTEIGLHAGGILGAFVFGCIIAAYFSGYDLSTSVYDLEVSGLIFPAIIFVGVSIVSLCSRIARQVLTGVGAVFATIFCVFSLISGKEEYLRYPAVWGLVVVFVAGVFLLPWPNNSDMKYARDVCNQKEAARVSKVLEW